MTKQVNHINEQPELNRETRELISGTRIVWNKTKDEIWGEMQEKMATLDSGSPTPATIRLQIVRYAAAAVLTLFFGISAAMFFYTKKIETPIVQQTEISLPDDSKVRLYEQSVLSYKPLLWRFSRTVRFEGEGYFEVQKGSKFEVISENGRTAVLGTRFYIDSRNTHYTVTCESGRVKVTEPVRKNEVIITGGQKAILRFDNQFEVVRIPGTRSEDTDQPQNQILDNELNNILVSPQEPSGIEDRLESRTPSAEQDAENRQTTGKNPAEVAEQEELNQQMQTQEQVQEVAQKKEQEKEQVRNENGKSKQEQSQGEKEKPEAAGQSNKEKLRASLTPEQISILEDQEMSREEKRKAFMESLSSEQRQWIQEQNEEQTRQGEGGQNGIQEKENLKEQQKNQNREQNRESSGNTDKEMLRQQTLENKDNIQQSGSNHQGSGNGSGQ